MTYYPKMLKKYKTRWVKALRSGNFTQGFSSLHCYEAYCCLGVLSEAVLHAEQVYGFKGSSTFLFDNNIKSSVEIPYSVFRNLFYKKYLEDTKYVTPEDVHSILITMNDANKQPFVKIADWIEENL